MVKNIYTDYEFDIIRSEVRRFRELGAQGVVIGMLRPDGSLDVEHKTPPCVPILMPRF